MPTRLLHLLPDPHPSAALTQVRLLGEHLLPSNFSQQVAVLSGRGAGGPPHVGPAPRPLDRRFAWDPFAVARLRRVVRQTKPDVLHAWGAHAALYAMAAGGRSRRVTTLAAGERPPRFWPSGAAHSVLQAPRGVPLPPQEPPAGRAELGLPAEGRLIGAVSRLTPEKHVKELIWAIDLVRVIQGDAWLVVVGEGPAEGALRRFNDLACEENRTVWLGARDDVPALLPHLQVLWHAGREARPAYAVLEAMAAGVPVVADNASGAAEAITHEVDGLLTAPDDRAGRAKATLALLEDDDARRRLGEAARAKVARDFPLDGWLNAHRVAYRRKA